MVTVSPSLTERLITRPGIFEVKSISFASLRPHWTELSSFFSLEQPEQKIVKDKINSKKLRRKDFFDNKLDILEIPP